MSEKAALPWETLMGTVNRWRSDRVSFTRELAAVRKGATATTEHYAYPYILPYTQGLRKDQQTALLRLVAMLAEYPDIPVYKSSGQNGVRLTFGRWCYQLTCALAGKKGGDQPRPGDSGDLVGQRLAYLHTQTLEEAMQSIRRLLSLANSSKNAPALDIYGLARLALYWGNGLSPQSQETRQQILRDYYSAFIYRANDDASTTDPKED